MAIRHRSPVGQGDLFNRPSHGADVPPLPDGPPASDEPYEPTAEDEQALLEAEHGPNVRYIPPKSSGQRRAEQGRIRDLIDRTMRMLRDEPEPQGGLFGEDEEGKKR